VPERARLFARPRRATTIQAPIRMLGGLPDASLFPRTSWARHYRAALAQVPNAQLTYPDLLGAEALRQALSRYLGRVRGVAATGEDVLICGGVTQGLALVCRALGRRGVRRIAVEDPCFGIHRSVIAMAGLEPVPVSVDADGLDPSRLRETDVEAILVAPAHSYPMGATLTAERRVELVRWARDRNAVIIEDDYDAEFRYDRAPIGALQGLAPDQVVHLGSASKTLTPALRLGWVVAPRDLLAQLAAEKHFDDMGSGLLEQITFARFIDRGDLARFLRRVRPVYRSRRDTLTAAITELLPDATWTGEAAGLHLLVSLPPGVGERELTLAARERGVLIEDGSWHWASPDEAPPTVVLGYGATPEPTIRRAIALVAEALNDVRR
jgi:GntR family transcriptional regulator/MocR family aminotransferase